MSSTYRFTPLHPLDHEGRIQTNRNAHGAGVRINDPDGLRDALPDTLSGQMDTRDFVEREEYPGREWTLLLGFTTWGRDDDEPFGGADYHNVSNTDAKDMAGVWATVSTFTEPFVLYCTGYEGHWPHAARLEEGDGVVYRVEADDGAVTVDKIAPGIESREDGWHVVGDEVRGSGGGD